MTKFTRVGPLLNLPYNKHTRFRFSVNSDYVIDSFEYNTPSRDQGIKAAGCKASQRKMLERFANTRRPQ